MVIKIISWLEGIVEDDPIPIEITHILFNTRKNGQYKYIELIGYENGINKNNIAYYPLEAQFFYCNELAQLNNNEFEYMCKYLIEESFSSKILKNQFKNKKIYYLFNNKLKYLFKV